MNWFKKLFIKYQTQSNKHFLSLDKRVVAELYTTKRVDFVTIWGVSVVEDLRGHGLGKSLMKKTLATLSKEFSIIKLETGINNAIAINLYSQLGFKEYARDKVLIYFVYETSK